MEGRDGFEKGLQRVYEGLIKGLGMDTLVTVFSWNMKSSSLKNSGLKSLSRKSSSLKSSSLTSSSLKGSNPTSSSFKSSSLKSSSLKANGEVGLVRTFKVRLKGGVEIRNDFMLSPRLGSI